jgi:hypothetical protein
VPASSPFSFYRSKPVGDIPHFDHTNYYSQSPAIQLHLEAIDAFNITIGEDPPLPAGVGGGCILDYKRREAKSKASVE